MAWTEERVATLTKLWLEGLSAAQIAVKLGEGVTRNAVIGKVHRLKLSGRSKPANATHRSRSTSRAGRHPGARSGSGGGGGKRRTISTPVMGANALSPSVDADASPMAARRAEEIFVPPEKRIGILGLTENTCKWPIGDPLLDDFHFCGHDSEENAPYCKFHAKRAYHTLDRKKK
ncbi:MAG TPA: GcrA cell cycle regulator [Devosia sp.]|nr:GcrA cell cycle regulator [Devosia sp.]